ncbi:MAG: hypothetical protein UT86_C0001G0193 [Candidatus Magasanikbacteria bacterium GW2011_GWC2_40_17]|uniref:Uncharacterized protein n=1 Tax=Candidatus Magasanikbacteria bacterium GW2011_GWA2_42_32 TaxID=1619039 RepID=A0A0G1D663_9BACT|nr:MAG: hypothetical protein UT86_C0001G0193 [Candidatus Magasanikbacteria bacterium GW2011_GWC2_40_17]KKS57553.1 MAG: hypothetical protein UV20_C0001G0193 [Candidatus Magasanikbacteria bacterium GW2011_GWA2_42_32]
MFESLFSKNKIKIKGIKQGSHGDHWGAFFGFQNFRSNPKILLDKIEKILDNKNSIKIDNKYSKSVENIGQVDLIVISDNKGMASCFPLLNTKYNLPFESKEINERNHVGNIEAQIIGGGRKTFALNFFATDYLNNKQIYKTTKELKINLSAFAYVIKESENLPDKFSNDFVTYMPNTESTYGDVYDFIGKIIDFAEYNHEDIEGYIVKTKLINNEKMEDFFNLDIFVNKENMRIENLKRGTRISGCFWLQGNIV